MLKKGMMKLINDQLSAFYGRLFLVEKATGGWRPVIDLFATQHLRGPFVVQDGDSHVHPGLYLKWRVDVLGSSE